MKQTDLIEYKVSYNGFLTKFVRYFATKDRAEQWARQVGKFEQSKIERIKRRMA